MSVCAAVVILFCGVAIAQQAPAPAPAPKEVTLEITEADGNYILTVPVSALVMAIPKGGLESNTNPAGGAADSPRFFYFEDKSNRLLISGWFESDEGFPGIKEFWARETAAYKRGGLPEPRDVTFVQLGNWNAILYDEDIRVGKNSHIRAHWVQVGTWIDVHLSLTADLSQKEIREKLQATLKTIRVTEKP